MSWILKHTKPALGRSSTDNRMMIGKRKENGWSKAGGRSRIEDVLKLKVILGSKRCGTRKEENRSKDAGGKVQNSNLKMTIKYVSEIDLREGDRHVLIST
jgi:hypothetical protein